MQQDTAWPPGHPTAQEPINAQLKNADLQLGKPGFRGDKEIVPHIHKGHYI